MCAVFAFNAAAQSEDASAESYSYENAQDSYTIPYDCELYDYLFNRGDANLDGRINASDTRLALRAAAQLEVLNMTQTAYADVDIDGQVSASDARAILRYSASIGGFGVFAYNCEKGGTVTLGPLFGTTEHYWYLKTALPSVELSITETRDGNASTPYSSFKQTFTITEDLNHEYFSHFAPMKKHHITLNYGKIGEEPEKRISFVLIYDD